MGPLCKYELCEWPEFDIVRATRNELARLNVQSQSRHTRSNDALRYFRSGGSAAISQTTRGVVNIHLLQPLYFVRNTTGSYHIKLSLMVSRGTVNML
jgi:hypothetical protein